MDDPEERFTELYDRHYRNVLGYALLRAERQSAEDIASETFLIAWRRLAQVPEHPLPWLLVVARNLLRKQRHLDLRPLRLTLCAPEVDVADQVGERQAALDARSFLLAGADNAARADAKAGRYWYSRERSYEPQPSGEVLVSSTESWYDGETGRGRTTSGLDAEVVAGGATAEAEPTPRTRDFRITLLTSIGGESLSQDDLWRLPREAEDLRRWLEARRRGEPSVDFTFSMTRLVLSGPTTPATRAAMLRVLADQPGLRLERGVADPIGRPGAAVVSADGANRLIVDESGARLLAEEYHGPDREEERVGRGVRVGARTGEKTVYESSGWVEKIGERP